MRVGADAGTGETVVLRLHGELADHAESVVLPLLLPDAPVVVLVAGGRPAGPGEGPAGRARPAPDHRRRTPPSTRSGAVGARAEAYAPGDTDLAWTRITPWRSMLAAALDQKHRARSPSAAVEGEAYNPSCELLAMWLADRLGVPVERKVSDGPGLTAVRLEHRRTATSCLDRAGRLAGRRWRCRASRTGGGAQAAGDRRADRRGAAPARPGRHLRADGEVRRRAPDRHAARTRRPASAAGDAPAAPAAEAPGGREEGAPAKKAAAEVSTPQVVVHRDKELMAQAAAARLITKIVDAQAARGSASVVLTGGRNGNGAAGRARRVPRAGRGGLVAARPVVGRRAVPARGRPGAQRHPGPGGAAGRGAAGPGPGARRCPPSDGPYGSDVEAAAGGLRGGAGRRRRARRTTARCRRSTS